MNIFLHIPDPYATGYYRAQLPLLQCYSQLSAEGILIHSSRDLMSFETYFDAYIFHRLPDDNILWFCREQKEKGKKIIWSIDDDLEHMPEWAPTKNQFENNIRIKVMKDLADTIIVSTKDLQQKMGERAIYCPNLVDPNAFIPADSYESYDKRLKILWAGSTFHDEDFSLVVPSLEKIMQEFGDVAQIVFWGYLPTQFATMVREPGAHFASLVVRKDIENTFKYLEAAEFRCYFPNLMALRPDIAICPLVECPYNNSKSNIKYLEMTMAGAAVVASAVGPYASTISDKKDGLLVSIGDNDNWYYSLRKLILDLDLRKSLNNCAQGKVISQYSWTGPDRELWLESFRRILK